MHKKILKKYFLFKILNSTFKNTPYRGVFRGVPETSSEI